MHKRNDRDFRPQYAIGEPVLRQEDPTLLRGEGRYTDDLNEPGGVTPSCGALALYAATNLNQAKQAL